MRGQQRRPENRSADGGVTLAEVTHGFDGTPVLEEVSLSVQAGEVLAIIGPSGTGKTTVLRLLSFFDAPDEGSVTVDGTDVWSLSERERLATRRRVAMVFQEANLFDASVARNVSYGRRVRRSWQDRIRGWVGRIVGDPATNAVDETLGVVGMADADAQNTTSLSGGEAQRVSFARAMACDPDFLLLDEPTSDLDPRNTAVLEEAMETASTQDIGVVVATHDMNQAERVADRVVVLIDGEVIEVGPTDRVFSDPTDPRARKFIDGELVY